ncbi:MAG: hypothetical protein WBE86_13200 [Candidatus Acidiferrales bacterium]
METRFGMPPLPPRKGTPEAIIAEQLAASHARRVDAPNPAGPAAAPVLENKTQTQTSNQNPIPPQNPNLPKASKERTMSSTRAAHAKATVRASRSGARAKSPISSIPSAPAQFTRVSSVEVPSSLERHSRKCSVCKHPDRELIEEMFLHWHSPSTIYKRFLLRDRSSIYDHAHATGLYLRRRRNLRCALEFVIERAEEAPISSHGIVRAIKAYASITDAGEWVEPPSRVVFSTESSAVSNRHTNGLEIPPTHTKQTLAPLSGNNIHG